MAFDDDSQVFVKGLVFVTNQLRGITDHDSSTVNALYHLRLLKNIDKIELEYALSVEKH